MTETPALTAASVEAAVRAIHPAILASVRELGTGLSFDYLGIRYENRGAGLADRAVAFVCELADARGLPIVIKPDAGFGSDFHRLVRWYTRHGFVPVRDTVPFTMQRTPRMVTATDTDYGDTID